MKPGQRHYAVCVNVSEREHALIAGQARDSGLSVSDYVRRCINGTLLEVGDDVPLLAEKRSRDAVAV